MNLINIPVRMYVHVWDWFATRKEINLLNFWLSIICFLSSILNLFYSYQFFYMIFLSQIIEEEEEEEVGTEGTEEEAIEVEVEMVEIEGEGEIEEEKEEMEELIEGETETEEEITAVVTDISNRERDSGKEAVSAWHRYIT